MARTWRSAAYPKTGDSKDAAGVVWSKAPQIIRTFDQGVVIRSNNGFWLAIPTENAPKKGVGGKRVSPSNFPEHRFGKLRFVKRNNRLALLVVEAVGFSKKTGRVTRVRKGGAYTKTGRLKSGTGSAVMFILVPQIKMPKRLDVEREARKWHSRLLKNIDRNLSRADQSRTKSRRS